MPRSGIAKSYGNSIFSFLRNFHLVLYGGFISLHSHQQWKTVPFSPHPLKFFVDIFDDGLSGQCEVALPCVSLLISPFWLSLHPPTFFYWVVCSFYIFWRFIASVAADGIYSSVYISIPNLQSEISPHTSQNGHHQKAYLGYLIQHI